MPPAVAGQPVESTTVAANTGTEFTSNALPRRVQDAGNLGAVDCSAAGLRALCELEAQGPDALPAAFRGGWGPQTPHGMGLLWITNHLPSSSFPRV